jgi:hypothetical protein
LSSINSISVSSSISSIRISSSSNVSTQDTDQVADITENAAPNNGDGNGDGVLDYLQSNVTSIPEDITGKYLTVALDPTSPCQELSKVNVISSFANGVSDNNYTYPAGLVDFESNCNSTMKIKMYWYGLDKTNSYINRKYLPTLNTFVPVESTQKIETVNGVEVVTFEYSVVDNGPLDDDPTVGKIKDPIGPGLPIPVQNNNSNTGGIISIISQSIQNIFGSPQSSISSQSAITSNSKIENIKTEIQNEMTTSETTQDNNAEILTVRTGGPNDNSNLFAVLLIISGLTMMVSFHTGKQARKE